MKKNIINWALEIPFNDDIKKEYLRYLQIKNKINDGYENYLFDNFLREFFTPLFKDMSEKNSDKFSGEFKMKRSSNNVTGTFKTTEPIDEEYLDEFKSEFKKNMKELLNSDDFNIKY